jgi:hypothetical protein
VNWSTASDVLVPVLKPNWWPVKILEEFRNDFKREHMSFSNILDNNGKVEIGL